MTPPPSDRPPAGPVEPSLEVIRRLAVEDLAAQLGIDSGEVTVLNARAVVWPDTSLGCPRPGMQYLPVPQDGAEVVLEALGGVYRYHSGGNRPVPFLCTAPEGPDRPRRGGVGRFGPSEE